MTLYRNQYRIESGRRLGWDYASAAWYFVTLCTQDRACFFGDVVHGEAKLSPIGRAAYDQWLEITSHYRNVETDAFVVMPNHVHGVVALGKHPYSKASNIEESPAPITSQLASPRPGSLAAIVRSYKAGVTRWCRSNGFQNFQWQSRFYDRIILGPTMLDTIRGYIADNPINWLEDENYRDVASYVSTP